MKKIFIALCVLSFFACAHNQDILIEKESEPVLSDGLKHSEYGDFYYVGLLGPFQIATNWERVNEIAYSPIMIELYFQNPNSEDEIRYATILGNPMTRQISDYSYMLDGEIYVFTYNPESNCFEPNLESQNEYQEQWHKDYNMYFGFESS